MFGKVIALSGGFDPLHAGHVRMINHAAAYGQVVIILNSDDWLTRKKGYVFMPYEERAEVIQSLHTVAAVRRVDDTDSTVCEALKRIVPDYFGNGGDRGQKNTPEKELCEKLGVELVWNLGGGKIQSSSKLVEETKEKEEMQEVPNDAIILSPDEARAMLLVIRQSSMIYVDSTITADNYEAALLTLDEQLEEDSVDEP